jgi:mycoredoxin
MSTTELTIYNTQWCGYCQRLKAQLNRAGVPFTEIDIEQDEAAAVFVASVNSGNLTVPTVVLPSGAALTNPSVARVLEALAN